MKEVLVVLCRGCTLFEIQSGKGTCDFVDMPVKKNMSKYIWIYFD